MDVHSFQPLKVRYCYRSALQVHIDPLPGLGVATEAPWNQAMIAVDLLFFGAQPYGNMMLACRNFSKRCCSLCRVLMGVVPIDPCEPPIPRQVDGAQLIGCTVLIQGLVRSPEFNGQFGWPSDENSWNSR